jgi:putative protease
MEKVELLAPAGDLERLKIAVSYGADAVYAGFGALSLRGRSCSLEAGKMAEGIDYAHGMGKKAYAAVNVFAGDADLPQIESCARELRAMGADAAIVSDLGAMDAMRQAAPELPIHVSTQANCANSRSAGVLHRLGAKRIVLARELSLDDVGRIGQSSPPGLELEVFVHGAMCMAYSGRCMISKYLANRDANRGDCAQPCRWRYSLMEEKLPGTYMPVQEDARGTYLFNADDLCLIEHIPEIIGSGVAALKIEGRAKSAYYVATAVSAYRAAIDHYYGWLRGRAAISGGGGISRGDRGILLEDRSAHVSTPAAAAARYAVPPEFLAELSKASHRRFTTGFAFAAAKAAAAVAVAPNGADNDGAAAAGAAVDSAMVNDGSADYVHEYEMVGIVRSFDASAGVALVEQRNRFFSGDAVEVMLPGGGFFRDVAAELADIDGNPIRAATRAQMAVRVKLSRVAPPYSILRKKTGAAPATFAAGPPEHCTSR